MAATDSDTQPIGTTPGGIVGFLLARIAEDEAVARVASQTIGDGEWLSGGDVVKSVTLTTVATTPVGHHMARHDPARVLAECQAKRAIIEDHAPTDESYERPVYDDDGEVTYLPRVPACRQCTTSTQPERITSYWDQENRVDAPCDTIRHLAAVYADHPDYQPAWRP